MKLLMNRTIQPTQDASKHTQTLYTAGPDQHDPFVHTTVSAWRYEAKREEKRLEVYSIMNEASKGLVLFWVRRCNPPDAVQFFHVASLTSPFQGVTGTFALWASCAELSIPPNLAKDCKRIQVGFPKPCLHRGVFQCSRDTKLLPDDQRIQVA